MSKIRFPEDMPKAPSVADGDKMMLADASTNEAKHITFDQAKQYFTIEGQRIAPIAPGVLPAGPSGQTRYMEVTAVGSWTYGGNTFTNADGYKTLLWWNGTTWSNAGSVKIKGDSGEDGKTIEDYSNTKAYPLGSQVFFNNTEIYEALSATTAGESPITSPSKWILIFKGTDISDQDLLDLQGYSYSFEVSSYIFEQGNFNAAGTPVASDYFIRTSSYITSMKVGVAHTLVVPSSKAVNLYYFNDAGVYVSSSGQLNAGTHTITPLYKNVKLTMRFLTGSTNIVPTDADTTPKLTISGSYKKIATKLSELTATVTNNDVAINTKVDNLDVRFSKGEATINGADTLYTFIASDYTVGSINATTGETSVLGSGVYTSKKKAYRNGSLTINRPSQGTWPHNLVIFKYDSAGNYLGTTGNLEVLSQNVLNKVDFDEYRIQLAKIPVSAITPSEAGSQGFNTRAKKIAIEDKLAPYFNYQELETANNTTVIYKVGDSNITGLATNSGRGIIKNFSCVGFSKINITMPTGFQVSANVWRGDRQIVSLGFRDVLTADLTKGDYLNLVLRKSTNTTFTTDDITILNTQVQLVFTKELNNQFISAGKRVNLTKASPYKLGVDSIAHRGLYTGNLAPENSVDAFKLAAMVGFEWAETDVLKTSDGHYVIMHDESINRTMTNLDGSEITTPVLVASSTLADLRANYRLSSPHARMRKPIPTLDDLIDTCKRYNIKPIIELKYAASDADIDAIWDKCASMLGRKGFAMSSFTNSEMEYARTQYPDLIIHWLGKTLPTDFPNDIYENDYVCVGGGWQSATNVDTFVPQFNKKNIKVGVWQFNTNYDIRQLSEKGFSFVTYNYVPYLNKFNALFAVDSLDSNATALFQKNGVDVIFSMNSLMLSDGDILTISDYIDNHVMYLGASEYLINFSGQIKIDGSNVVIDSATYKDGEYYGRQFLINSNCSFKIQAMGSVTINRVFVKVVKF